MCTTRGPLAARKVVLALGHDVDRHFPDLADDAEITRCALHMLRIKNPTGRPIDPGVFTGLSLLRYDGFATCPSLDHVRDRFAAERPELLAAGVNLMFTQLPNGDLTIGDTHTYARTVDAYRGEDLDDLLLNETRRLLDVPKLTVRERWRGVYAAAPAPFLIAAPMPDVRVVSVTSGIGMTTALGLAPEVLDDLLA